MSVATEKNGQIQPREAKPGAHLVSMLQQMGPEMARAMPKHLTPDRMARVTLTALRTTKDLVNVTRESFMACVMTLSQLGLEPSNGLGFAWLIPRRNKGVLECTVIIGYQGLMELARRSGQIRSITAQAVYDGDDFECTFGLVPTLRHVPDWTKPRTRETLRGAYAVARVKDSDDPIFVFIPKVEIEASRKRGASGAGVKTPWDTDYEAMALKTAIRRLFRWLPKSVEMATAARIDEAPTASLVAASEAVAHALDAGGLSAPVLEVDATPYDPETGEVSPEDEPRE